MLVLGVTVASAESLGNNEAMKLCLEKYNYTSDKFHTFDWNKAAACASDFRIQKNNQELAEMRDFLKHNPRYRYPGQSLNKCFGKPREMPFESAYLKVDETGFEASVNYKDKLPAGCFESAPWDNRDVEN